MSVILLFSLIVYIFASYQIGCYVYAVNPDSDLIIYEQGLEYYGYSYFEPLAGLYFYLCRLLSDLISIKPILPLISSVAFSIYIYNSRRAGFIIFFWLTSSGFVLSLINIRYVVALIIFSTFRSAVSRLLVPLAHWTLFVLWLPKGYSYKAMLLSIFLLPLFLYFDLSIILSSKIDHYVSMPDKAYGYAVFFESIILYFSLAEMYKKLSPAYYVNAGITLLTFVAIFLGLPIVAGRLVTLNIFTSIFYLKNARSAQLKWYIKFGLILISMYEIYRQLSMLGFLINF